MKIIYIPENFHLIVNSITKTLSKSYDRKPDIYLYTPSHFDMINIIIQMRKDEIHISSLFSHDLTKFTIIETQDNYYISMGIHTACTIAYIRKIKSEFAYALYHTIKGTIPNIFNTHELVKYFKEANKHSLRNIDYTHRYMDILNDIYSMNNMYMRLLGIITDMTREELNKLFRITVKYLIPVKRINGLKSISSINSFNNDYNYYKNRFYDASILEHSDAVETNIIQYLNCLSRDDKYTRNNVMIEFKTSIYDINRFTQGTCNSYIETRDNITEILPISTLADMFISISLHDIVTYCKSNEDIKHLKDLLLFRNDYMNFALDEENEEAIENVGN